MPIIQGVCTITGREAGLLKGSGWIYALDWEQSVFALNPAVTAQELKEALADGLLDTLLAKPLQPIPSVIKPTGQAHCVEEVPVKRKRRTKAEMEKELLEKRKVKKEKEDQKAEKLRKKEERRIKREEKKVKKCSTTQSLIEQIKARRK